MKKVYSSPIIDGIYTLDYASAPARKKRDALNAAGLNNSADSEAVRKEGYQQGLKDAETAKQDAYRKGLNEGCKQAEEKLATVFRAFQDIVKQLQSEKCTIWQKTETEIIKLVLAVAQKMVGYEITNNTHLIEKVVEDAISRSGEQKILSIRLNPADATKLKDTKIGADSDSTIEIIADQKISPGGCIVETDFGCIDAQLETRMSKIIEQMLAHSEGGTDKPLD